MKSTVELSNTVFNLIFYVLISAAVVHATTIQLLCRGEVSACCMLFTHVQLIMRQLFAVYIVPPS